MKASVGPCIMAISLLTALAIPARTAAQVPKDMQYRYIVVDVGTFGGPNSGTVNDAKMLNNQGMLVGGADTALLDTTSPKQNPQFPDIPDPFIQHAFLQRHGVLTDLGALPGTNSSYAYWVNARGDALGLSTNGVVDPLKGYPETAGILWKDGRIINLGTLGGYENSPNAMNNRDQITGIASNAIPDPYSLANWGTQTRGYLWQDGVIHDIGTLGGPDAQAWYINERGQIAGWSYTNLTPNPVTKVPTVDPFLWQNGHMQDLGTLGGTNSIVNSLTDGGMVVGQSNLAGDLTYHPFLWDGRALKDLGTFGGKNGLANWVNEAGDVVGNADISGSKAHHAFLWRKGVLIDLGTVAGSPCSTGYGINARDQVVGDAGKCGVGGTGWLWDHGSIYDLNTLVAPSPSGLHLGGAVYINNRGEIKCEGFLPNGKMHAVLLIPSRH
ncbi:MAG TPA: hypothetical protein VIJ28_22325 [Chloroflexota bacterium]